MLTMYSKPGCTACEKAKTYLAMIGVKCDIKDITEDSDARNFVIGEGHRSLPQIYQDNKLLPGGYAGLTQADRNILRG